MKAARLTRKPVYPVDWKQLPNGEQLRQQVEQAVTEPSRMLFGYHLVKLGNLSAAIDLPQCTIKHKVNLTELPASNSSIISMSRELPLLESSVDAFLLANELDFAQDPHQVLREVDRAIMPNGHVIISGFNPISLAGLMKYLPVNRKSPLHQARFFTCGRIKDWLHLLGFEIIEQRHILFSELFFERKFNPDSYWQKWCKRYMPYCSAIYVLVAKKRVVPLSIIKPDWKPSPSFTAVGASMRELG